MMKALKMVRQLRLLIDCIVLSLSALMWSCVLLAAVSCIFSVFLVQQVTVYREEVALGLREATDDSIEELYRNFGNVFVSMLSLFKAGTCGVDWATYYDPFEE